MQKGSLANVEYQHRGRRPDRHVGDGQEAETHKPQDVVHGGHQGEQKVEGQAVRACGQTPVAVVM